MTTRNRPITRRYSAAIAFVFTLVLGLPASADLDRPSPDSVRTDSRVDNSLENYCIGGLENRKLIPQDGRVNNPFRQTTILGCSVDGGVPTIMPDLIPAVRDGKLA